MNALMRFAAAVLPGTLLEKLIRICVTVRLRQLEPGSGLKFLFDLDAFLYGVEGKKAVEYGGGVHTKHRHTRYHDFFTDRIRPGERVLDIGCGNGALAYDIAEKSKAQVTGIDIRAENVRVARKRFAHARVTYVHGDAVSEPFRNPADVVVLSNVLEHLGRRGDFLNSLRQQVKPKRLLVRVPLFERDWRVPLRKELGAEWRLDPTHEIEYTLESFAGEMTAAGMEVRHQEVRWGEIWAEVQVPEK